MNKRKVYYLSTCNTCTRIMKEVGVDDSFEKQDLKEQNISGSELDILKELVGSYESLFNRRSRKYRAMGLHEREHSDEEFRRLILDEYTFLKRPIFLIDNSAYVGNAKKTVEEVKKALESC